MASLYRLTWLVLLSLLSVTAHALVPKSTVVQWRYNSTVAWELPAPACVTAGPKKRAEYPAGYTVNSPAPLPGSLDGSVADPYCTFTLKDPQGQFVGDSQFIMQKQSTLQCPANSTASGSACACNVGFQENAAKTACEAPPPVTCQVPLGGSLGGAGTQHTSAGYTGGLICQNGCGAAPASAGKVGDKWYAWGPFTSVGTTCTGTVGGSGDTASSAPPSEPAPSPCATGQCPGTINGTEVCRPCDTTKEDPPPKKDESTVKNPDGSTTTTTTTTNTTSSCSGNSCNTTTTTTVVSGGKNADGTPKTPTTTKEEEVVKEETKGDFCKGNPNHASCKDGSSSSFDGTCAGGFKAKSEDAVLNALAEETFRQNCKVTPDEASTQLATAEMAKTGDQTLNNPNNSTVSISQANFDTSNALGGGASCPADRQVQVWKWGFTLRMSSVCPSLEMLGAVMLAFSFLLGARIVARG